MSEFLNFLQSIQVFRLKLQMKIGPCMQFLHRAPVYILGLLTFHWDGFDEDDWHGRCRVL